jgi:hypothetical protein
MEPDPLDDPAEVAPEALDDADEELDPREAARLRRRDHDAMAHERDLMRSGMGKVFKQIDESIVRRAKPASHRGHKPGDQGQ